MSDELIKHGHAGEDPEYEHEDLGTRGIFAFLISLAVSGIIIVGIIVGMYRFLDTQERSQMTTASPLVPLKGDMSRNVTSDEMDALFKENGAPMLEIDERTQFRQFLVDQENQLNSFGWVDEKAGVAHIPIQNAMDLIVQHGIPVCAQNCGGLKATAEDRALGQKSVVQRVVAQKAIVRKSLVAKK